MQIRGKSLKLLLPRASSRFSVGNFIGCQDFSRGTKRLYREASLRAHVYGGGNVQIDGGSEFRCFLAAWVINFARSTEREMHRVVDKLDLV